MAVADFQSHVIAPRGVLYNRLLQYADAFMSMIAQTAACNSLHTIDERLARWLLMTQDRVNRADIPLTQKFLSFMLGVRRVSVSVAASELQQRGFIQYTRGHVKIINRAGLEHASCACYSIVQSITEELLNDFAAAS